MAVPDSWLDQDGSHNQPAMPNVELSGIYHFKGRLRRCNGFHGKGTDSKGNRLTCTATTDYTYMLGEYWAARRAQHAIFAPYKTQCIPGGPGPPRSNDFHSAISRECLYWVTPGHQMA
jgi:hypothetical protein